MTVERIIHFIIKRAKEGLKPVERPVNDEMGEEADWLAAPTPDRSKQDVPEGLQVSKPTQK